ncbi:MAG TPA: hypothetical protein VG028_15820 [Terriglobia bacterium]|nr:hypothetical protein [Terriglobia bacterium]
MAVVAVALALLVLLVWFLNPRQPDFKPAPLEPPSPVCPNPGRQFVPSDLVAVTDPDLERLPADKKIAALRRLNTTACTCGCQLSVVYCRGLNSACDTSRQMFGKIVSEGLRKSAQPPGKK